MQTHRVYKSLGAGLRLDVISAHVPKVAQERFDAQALAYCQRWDYHEWVGKGGGHVRADDQPSDCGE
jgi:hypothetical protein